jgi:hypothetical protein
MSIVANLIGPVTGLLDKFVEDKDQKAKLAHELATMADSHAQQLALAQVEVNKAEAQSGSVFKGGWRPFVGWCSGIAVLYHFILSPCILFGVALSGIDIPPIPTFDMTSLMTVLMGMLGLGGLRTFEKTKGVTK